MPLARRRYELRDQLRLRDRGGKGRRTDRQRRPIGIALALATPFLAFALLLFMQHLEEHLMAAPARMPATTSE